MIGHVLMEIEADEMRAAVAYYLNREVFMVEGYPSRVGQKAIVSNVRQRSNGNFVVEFDGWQPTPKVKVKTVAEVQAGVDNNAATAAGG